MGADSLNKLVFVFLNEKKPQQKYEQLHALIKQRKNIQESNKNTSNEKQIVGKTKHSLKCDQGKAAERTQGSVNACSDKSRK